jgi:hypothetical protein
MNGLYLRLMCVSAALLMPAMGACQGPSPQAVDARLATGRSLAQQFGAELKNALQQALTEKGPVAAIAVCKLEAPRIAARLSAESGASVARTSLRVRNAANAALPWQRAVLESFETRLIAGGKAEDIEHFEVQPDGGARYLKPIVTQPLCLVCHGESIAPELRASIGANYPSDTATGFKAGDLRGAFSIEWPAARRQSP